MASGGDFSRTLSSGHEPYFDYPCTLCEKEGRHKEALRYCGECFVFMCSSCVTNHNRFPLNTTHQLLDQSHFNKVTKLKLSSFPTKRCLKHPGELMNMFCPNHDVVCCGPCKALEHSSCPKTQYLTDAAKDVHKTQEYKDIRAETDDVIADVNRVLSDRNADIARIENKKQLVKQTIIDYRKKIDKYFDDLEEQSIDKLNEIAKKIIKCGEHDKQHLALMKSKAEDIRSQLEISFNGDNECDLFLQVKMARKCLGDATKGIRAVSMNVKKDDIYFTIDPRVNQLLSSVRALGTFTNVAMETIQPDKTLADTNINKPRENTLSTQNETPRTVAMSPDIFLKYKAQLFSKNKVNEKSDSNKCNISDICQISDGTILITDWNNMKLKRLDQTYKLLDSLQLPSKPHSVCDAGDGEVAVSLKNDKKVQFVSVEKKLKLRRSFNTGNCSRGMVYVDDKLFVSCGSSKDPSSGYIEVYNNSGKLQRSMPHTPHGSPSVPMYITVCDDGQHLLVTNYSNDDVTMIDLTGNVYNTFSDSNLKGTLGMCTDGNGQFFICGFYSNTVVQLDPKQQKIVVILGEKDGIGDPRAVCYDRRQSRLVVGCSGSNELLIFSLQYKKE